MLFWLIVAVLAFVVLLVVSWAAKEYDNPSLDRSLKICTICVGAVALVLLGTMNLLYSQDTGEVVVLRNWGGSLAGYTSEAGFHAKAPWQETVRYDVRNNTINLYHSDTEYSVDGGSATGPCVTVNDSGGASADVDLEVIYSLDGNSAEQLYEDYGTQANFVQNYVLNEVRATAREVAGGYDTMTMLTSRGDFTEGLSKALSDKWSDKGLNVEQVIIQDIRYPDEITSKYAEAQAAEVAKQQAQNEQETAKVEAETKKIQAQGEADANAIQTQQLTPEVLQKQYIDALNNAANNGCLIVVPEGSTPLVGTSGATNKTSSLKTSPSTPENPSSSAHDTPETPDNPYPLRYAYEY